MIAILAGLACAPRVPPLAMSPDWWDTTQMAPSVVYSEVGLAFPIDETGLRWCFQKPRAEHTVRTCDDLREFPPPRDGGFGSGLPLVVGGAGFGWPYWEGERAGWCAGLSIPVSEDYCGLIPERRPFVDNENVRIGRVGDKPVLYPMGNRPHIWDGQTWKGLDSISIVTCVPVVNGCVSPRHGVRWTAEDGQWKNSLWTQPAYSWLQDWYWNGERWLMWDSPEDPPSGVSLKRLALGPVGVSVNAVAMASEESSIWRKTTAHHGEWSLLHHTGADGNNPLPPIKTNIHGILMVVPWGEQGIVTVGYPAAEVWDGDRRIQRIPNDGLMSAGVYQGHPMFGIGASRVRADGPVLLSMDLQPGRFTWAAELNHLAWVQCPAGPALTWTDTEGRWYAMPQGDAMQISHTCPPTATPWPKGQGLPCTPVEGWPDAHVEHGELAACSRISGHFSFVQAVRVPPDLVSPAARARATWPLQRAPEAAPDNSPSEPSVIP